MGEMEECYDRILLHERDVNMKKYILRIIILLAYTGAFYIKIINQLTFAILAILCLVYICSNGKVKKRNFIFLLLIFLLVILGLYNTDGKMDNPNVPMYFAFWFIYSITILNDVDGWKDTILQNKRYVLIFTKLWCLLIGICMFLPMCYTHKDGTTGFIAFTGVEVASGGNRLCPIALLMLTMVYLCINIYEERKMIWGAIPCVYIFFMGGSRTYFAVGCALTVLVLYDFFPKKRYFYMTIIPIIMIGLVLVNMSAMGSRIAGNTWTEDKYGDYWYVLTSGRSVFWVKMLKAFSNQNLFHKLLGNGHNFTILTGGHWAHNDYIEILCTYGIVGLICYLKSMCNIFKKILHKANVTIIVWGISIFIWAFNAFFNMFYTYLCAELALPFMLLAIRYKYIKCEDEKEYSFNS